jgi:hypothetical protein
MVKPNRFPLQVSTDFKRKIDEIQKKIRINNGENKSLREITDAIISSPFFDNIEQNLIKTGKIDMDINLKFDRRKR